MADKKANSSKKPAVKAVATKEKAAAPKPAVKKEVKVVAPAVKKTVTAEPVASKPVKKIVSASQKAPKPAGPMITIKQVRSGAGKIRSQIQSLKGLGFRKLYQTVQVEDTPSVRGMIRAVQHLVKIINQ